MQVYIIYQEQDSDWGDGPRVIGVAATTQAVINLINSEIDTLNNNEDARDGDDAIALINKIPKEQLDVFGWFFWVEQTNLLGA